MPPPALLPQPPDLCPWSNCHQPAPVEVLLTSTGTLSHACSAGCYCLGHAVVAGIQAQTRHGGGLWYRPHTRPRHTVQASTP